MHGNDQVAQTPRLLVVAHGTASVPGRSTVERLVREVAAARPSTAVALCFLDVLAPTLPESLDDSPTVVVPLLLSTGYHVQSDIPQALAPFPRTVAARHLGPHPLLVDVLVDRLGPLDAGVELVLVGAGSSRPQAAAELDATGRLLGARTGRPITVATMTDDLRAVIAARPAPVRVATYLLAEGYFATTLASAAADRGATVTPPLGVHPALTELVWTRYDEALAAVR